MVRTSAALLLALLPALLAAPARATDLRVTKSTTDVPVQVGDPIVYTILVDNTSTAGGGPYDSPNTNLTDVLPAGLRFVSAEPTQGSCTATGQNVSCSLGTVPAGSEATVTLVVEATAAGSITNQASAFGAEFDPNTSNNTSSATVTVAERPPEADIEVEKTANSTTVLPGEGLSYTITITNHGPDRATNVVITDPLPRREEQPAVRFIAASDGCTESLGTVTCLIAALEKGESVTRTINTEVLVTGTFTNEAHLTELSETDPFSSNNSSDVDVSSGAQVDLSIVKTGPALVQIGKPVQYTLLVRNLGPGPATGVTVTDLLPKDGEGQPVLTVESVSPSDKCTVDEQTVRCDLGTLRAGEQVTLTVDGSISKFGKYVNTATVASSENDPAPEDNFATDTTQTWKPGISLDNALYSASTNDPVNTFTGELYLYEPPDLALAGPMPLAFRRYYASGLAQDGRITSALGPNWTHPFDWKLIVHDTTLFVEVVSPQGRVLAFERTGAGWTQLTLSEVPYLLRRDGTGFRLGDPRTGEQVAFDAAGLPTALYDGRGNRLTLTHTGGRLAEVSDGLGRRLTFTYAGGRLTGVSDGGRTASFAYDGAGRLSSASDAAGNTTTYAYDGAHALDGLLVSRTLPEGGTPYTQTYDASGRVTTQTDAHGHTTTLAYQPGATRITDAAGRTVTHAYDAAGRLVGLTDAAGRSVTVAYDAQGRRSRLVDRRGYATTYAYDPASGFTTAVTTADGGQTRYAYTPRTTDGFTVYDLTGATFADGTTATLAYDGRGRLTQATDRSGRTTTYTYDARGQLASVTNPAGGTALLTYAPDGTLASVRDAAGQTTTLDHDAFGRLVAVRHPDGTTRTTVYDAAGRPTRVTDERGQSVGYTYDDDGRLTRLTDPSGASMRYTYDAMGRLTQATDRAGGTLALGYDALGQVTSITDRNGHTWRIDYDATGHPAALTDPGGHVWRQQYDEEGTLVATTNAAGETHTFAPDAMGRIQASTDPGAHTTTFTHDRMGRLQALTDALGQRTTYAYDAQGRLAGATLPGGGAATYTRSALGLIDAVTAPGGGVWQFGHDAMGRLTAAADPLGRAVSYAYDARHRVAQATFPGGLGTAAFTYDGFDHLSAAAFSDGTDLHFTYDANGYLTSATGLALPRDANGWTTGSNGLGIARDAGGRVTAVQYPAGSVEYTYDARDLLVEVRDWRGGGMTFTYDPARRPLTMTRSNGVVTTFTYDASGQVVGIREALGGTPGALLAQSTLERDARGNVTTATREVPAAPALAAGTAGWTSDAAAQVAGFTYDALGRLTDDGARRYTWDLAGRLTAYTEGGPGAVTMTYDALGHRLTRTQAGTEEPGPARAHVWNYAFDLPAPSILSEAGHDAAYAVFAPDGTLLYRIDAATGQHRFYHFDEAGNTLFLTDGSGSVVATYAYTPFGQPLGGTPDPANPFTFGGRYGVMQETADGLYYMRARYYDSRTGRFLSRDPLFSLEPRRLNPYQYALGNPVRWTDPTGLNTVTNLDAGALLQPPAGSETTQKLGVVVVDEEEFAEIADDVRLQLFDRARKSSLGLYDPSIPGTFDSPFLARQDEQFEFRGRVMNGGELNYYFQGMYWATAGVPESVMIGIIFGYKDARYGSAPSDADLFAARQGYQDTLDRLDDPVSDFVDDVDASFTHSGIIGGYAGFTFLNEIFGLVTPPKQ